MTNETDKVTTSVTTTPDYAPDEVPVFLNVFVSDKIYFDYPDFDAVERLIERTISSDTTFGNVDGDSTRQPSNVETREDAIANLKERGKLKSNGLPDRANSDKGGIRTTQYLLKASTLDEHTVLLEDDEELRSDFHKRDSLDDETRLQVLKYVGRYFAERGVVPSNRSGELMPLGEWATTEGGNFVATIAKKEKGICPKCGADLDETGTCTSSPRSTRKAPKYKCDPDAGGCGYRYRGIATG